MFPCVQKNMKHVRFDQLWGEKLLKFFWNFHWFFFFPVVMYGIRPQPLMLIQRIQRKQEKKCIIIWRIYLTKIKLEEPWNPFRMKPMLTLFAKRCFKCFPIVNNSLLPGHDKTFFVYVYTVRKKFTRAQTL